MIGVGVSGALENCTFTRVLDGLMRGYLRTVHGCCFGKEELFSFWPVVKSKTHS